MQLSHSYSSIKMYENCPKRYYHQRVMREVEDTGNEATLWGERVHKMLEDRLKGAADLPKEVEKYEPLCAALVNKARGGTLLAEEEMTLNAQLRPTGWWAADAWLRSKIDVLILKGNTAAIFDWKTGKRRPDNLQLELFALQVFTHKPDVDKITSSFIWLKDNSVDSETYHRSEVVDMWERVLVRIGHIEHSQEIDSWTAKPSGLCRFCPCRDFCEFA